jgi:hypothetical protein
VRGWKGGRMKEKGKQRTWCCLWSHAHTHTHTHTCTVAHMRT